MLSIKCVRISGIGLEAISLKRIECNRALFGAPFAQIFPTSEHIAGKSGIVLKFGSPIRHDHFLSRHKPHTKEYFPAQVHVHHCLCLVFMAKVSELIILVLYYIGNV